MMGNFIVDFINFAILICLFRLIFNFASKGLALSRDKEKQIADNKLGSDVIHHEAKIETVHDTVCDSIVPKDEAYIAAIGDERYYFCSWECRKKFIEDRNREIENRPRAL